MKTAKNYHIWPQMCGLLNFNYVKHIFYVGLCVPMSSSYSSVPFLAYCPTSTTPLKDPAKTEFSPDLPFHACIDAAVPCR